MIAYDFIKISRLKARNKTMKNSEHNDNNETNDNNDLTSQTDRLGISVPVANAYQVATAVTASELENTALAIAIPIVTADELIDEDNAHINEDIDEGNEHNNEDVDEGNEHNHENNENIFIARKHSELKKTSPKNITNKGHYNSKLSYDVNILKSEEITKLNNIKLNPK